LKSIKIFHQVQVDTDSVGSSQQTKFETSISVSFQSQFVLKASSCIEAIFQSESHSIKIFSKFNLFVLKVFTFISVTRCGITTFVKSL